MKRNGIDPARLSRPHGQDDAIPPRSTAELSALLAELDRLLELNPPPGSAEMARLEELAGIVAMQADVLPPDARPDADGAAR